MWPILLLISVADCLLIFTFEKHKKSNNCYLIGTQILWLLQGECGREQTGELQDQENDHPLPLGRQLNHDH